MSNAVTADVVIFGGGIAGLWLLERLRQQGISVILFENNSLGGGQTRKAQGIIHGGLKYALQGSATADAKALTDMPNRWQACLAGRGDVDLSNVRVLSNQHYLFSPNRFTAKLTGFLAKAALTAQVKPLNVEAYPAVFASSKFKGVVFGLEEIVIDTSSLIRELVKSQQDAIYKIDSVDTNQFKFDEHGNLTQLTVALSGERIDVAAQQFVFAAGSGNEELLKPFNTKTISMQRRPLHMVVVKTSHDFDLYAHCVGLTARPRLTITSHRMRSGDMVWYLGGLLAEEGVARNKAEQIKVAKKELANIFPWLNFNEAEFATFMVDRAEPKQCTGFKPETAYMKSIGNVTVAWPTKLALTPLLIDNIMAHFQTINLSPSWSDFRDLRVWPMPPVATPIWEELFCKKDN